MTKRLMTEAQAMELSARNRGAKMLQRQKPHMDLQPGAAVSESLPPAKAPQASMHSNLLAPSETAECRSFIDWTKHVSFHGAALFDRVVKIANERGKAGPMIAVLQAIGMRTGFPDYIVLAPAGRWHGLFLEAKKRSGGKVDPLQEYWRDRLIEFGYEAVICAGALELIEATQRYFERAGCVADGSFIDRTRVQL